MSTVRPGRPREQEFGRYWREVCSCGWIGRQWTSHYAAQPGAHRRIRAGWFGDLLAETPARWGTGLRP